MREEPVLYDASLSGYKDHTLQKNIWKKIATEMSFKNVTCKYTFWQKWASRMSHVSTPFDNLCLVALKIPTGSRNRGFESSWRRESSRIKTALYCTEPFMSSLQSSRCDWNTVERDVQLLNHPLSIIAFNIICYGEKVSILIGLGMREEHLYGAFFRIVLMPLSVTHASNYLDKTLVMS